MDKASIFVSLQAAVDRGAASWADISLAVTRAKERKTKEQLDSLIGGWGLADLAQAEGIAWEEINKSLVPRAISNTSPPYALTLSDIVQSPPSSKSVKRKTRK